jgi:CRP-like cAMP-binding protein
VPCAECAIRKSALFRPVSEENLDWTQGYRAAQMRLPAQAHLYREGDSPEYCWTLYDGWVKLYKTLVTGKRQILRFAMAGDFLGFQPDLGGPMGHAAQALTDCTLCAFPRGRLTELFQARPEVATQFAWMAARDMRLCQEHLAGMGKKSARERIAYLLLEICHRQRQIARATGRLVPGDRVPVPITQEDIADAVGLTPVHVSRTLSQMRGERLIACAKGEIVIMDEDALTEIAEFDPQVLEAQPLL